MNNNLNKQYELRFLKNQQYRNEVWKILTASFFQEYIPSNSVILDLGCGWGEFINNIKAKKKIGMDLNADAKKYLDPIVEFKNQDCADEWPLDDNSLDIVFTSNFLEHLPSKSHVERTIIQIRRCLKPDGRLICLGPNIKYIPGLYWDFWDHHIELTETSLSEVLEMFDLAIKKKVAKFLPYTMANQKPPPLFALKLYLAFPVTWKIFGKQFLIIAQNMKEEK